MTDARALVRKSLPLTAADLRELALVRSSPEYRDVARDHRVRPDRGYQ